MLLCFVDESFKGDFYGFAGVVADEITTYELTANLNSLMRQVSVNWGIPASAELHGHEIFQGKGEWSKLPIRAQVKVYSDAIRMICAANVGILIRAVDRGRLTARQARENYPVNFPPEQVCFQHILQRANTLAIKHKQYALMIADERGDRERHRERFAMYQTVGTPGVYMHTKLDRLLDTVHFAPSHHSRMLQAADLIAFLFRRVSTVNETDPRAEKAVGGMWGTIWESGKVIDPGSWP